jgi:hypothetical protein
VTELGPNVSGVTLEQAQRMLAEGRSVEQVLAFLKSQGANAIASIRALQQLLGIDVPEAQRLLHESDVWREMQ